MEIENQKALEKAHFSRMRKGLGNEGGNTFAPQMPAINGCPYLLRCGFPNRKPQSEFISAEEKQEFQGF